MVVAPDQTVYRVFPPNTLVSQLKDWVAGRTGGQARGLVGGVWGTKYMTSEIGILVVFLLYKQVGCKNPLLDKLAIQS